MLGLVVEVVMWLVSEDEMAQFLVVLNGICAAWIGSLSLT